MKKTGETYDPPYINWKSEIKWDDPTDESQRDILASMYLPEHERFYRRKEIDTRLLNYEYYYIDYKAAATKDFTQGNIAAGSLNNRPQGLKDRSVYIKKGIINIYPDTLAWVHDFTYSFNEPMTQMYFWHPAFDNYPVVGVSWVSSESILYMEISIT